MIKNEIFKVKTGLAWCAWTPAQLALRLGCTVFEVNSALAGNERTGCRSLLRRAIVAIGDELERQCAAAERKCGVSRGEILRNLDF